MAFARLGLDHLTLSGVNTNAEYVHDEHVRYQKGGLGMASECIGNGYSSISDYTNA